MRSAIIQTRGYNPDIAGDELSLKISSYPNTARYLAERLAGEGATVCELCCGIGVSLLELAQKFDAIIGVDSDPSVIDHCRTNLTQAGCTSYRLLCGDVNDPDFLAQIKADIVLYDIHYWSDHGGVVGPERRNPDLAQLTRSIRKLITPNIVIYTPTELGYESVEQLVGPCEYLKIHANGKHDRNFVFLGDLMKHPGQATIVI